MRRRIAAARREGGGGPMRIFLMLTGAAMAAGALLFWIWLNAMGAAYNLARSPAPLTMEWLTGEALYYFWLPFAAGAAIAFIGWKRR
jgi:hypothetical protein